MDGASGQQTTRQKWSSQTDIHLYSSDSESENENIETDPSDAAIFITTFVPIHMKAGENLIWSNKKTSSVFYCRPINFQFMKETKVLTKKIITIIQKFQTKYKFTAWSFVGCHSM